MKKILVFFAFFIFITCKNTDNVKYKKLEGLALGTTFHITYKEKVEIGKNSIDSLIFAVNKSLSTYLKNSDISKINRGDTTIILDAMFLEVFKKSENIYKETNGAFDPTIGALVNAWGFGPGKELKELDKRQIDSLLTYVGFNKLKVENKKLLKQYPQTYLDFNANAKGYAVDIIGRYIESKGIENYLVEIGGEIRARGLNDKSKYWKIAIEHPNFDGSRSFQTAIELNNESIATSGNYRKFKIDKVTGKKYAHTINTKTGYPSNSNLLSASVIAKIDCADVDGYATALMAMGLNKSIKFLDKHKQLKAFLIYSDKNGEIKTYATNNLNAKN